jgi:hypothetical protein
MKSLSRCWNLNGEADPYCDGTASVLGAYNKAILGTKLAGPSYFCEFLNKVETDIEKNIERDGLFQNRVFSVLIVITDGNCHDMSKTT